MSTTPAAENSPENSAGNFAGPRRPSRGRVSWILATFVALLAPALVFWTWLLLALSATLSGLSARSLLLLALGLWVLISVALACSPSRGARTWGLGLLAGVLACLPWVAVTGLIV